MFLIPPEWETFRLVSERAVVADWKAFPFQEEAFLEWAKRMCDLGNIKECDFKNLRQKHIVDGYRTHTLESVSKIAQKYDVSYIISDIYYPQLKIIYQNKYYLYEIQSYILQFAREKRNKV